MECLSWAAVVKKKRKRGEILTQEKWTVKIRNNKKKRRMPLSRWTLLLCLCKMFRAIRKTLDEMPIPITWRVSLTKRTNLTGLLWPPPPLPRSVFVLVPPSAAPNSRRNQKRVMMTGAIIESHHGANVRADKTAENRHLLLTRQRSSTMSIKDGQADEEAARNFFLFPYRKTIYSLSLSLARFLITLGRNTIIK